MHELSIAQSIAETARGERRSQGIGTLKSIGLRIGALAGILPDSLAFCFDAITKDTDLDRCSLTIEHLPVMAECTRCGRSFEVGDHYFACPACGSGDVTVKQGFELEITYLEADDLAPAPGFTIDGGHNGDKNPA